MSRANCVALCSGLLVACSPGAGNDGWDSGFDSGDSAWTGDDSGGDTGAPLPDPAWIDLDATLTLAGGELGAASVTVRVLPEDSTLGANCEITRVATAISPSTPLPDPSVYGWWLLELEPDPGGCEGSETLSDAVLLGVGALHAQLAPAVAAEGLESAEASLYGAYVGFDPPEPDATEVTAYVLGLAGTEADRAGETLAVSAPPLPDGSYLVTGWFRFPVQ